MKVSSFILNVTSEQPERLAAFFRDTVQLEPHPQIGDSAFKVGEGASFVIDGHSDTKGTAKEPQRALINFWVDTPADVVARARAPRGSRRDLHPQRGHRVLGRRHLDVP